MCVCKLTHRNVSTVLPHIDWNTAFRMFSTEHIKWAPSTLYGGRLISNIHVYVVCSYFWHLPIAPFENDWRLPFTKPFASIQFHFYYIIHEMYAHTNVAFFFPFFFVIPGGCYHPEFKCADNVLQSIWKLCGRASFFFLQQFMLLERAFFSGTKLCIIHRLFRCHFVMLQNELDNNTITFEHTRSYTFEVECVCVLSYIFST